MYAFGQSHQAAIERQIVNTRVPRKNRKVAKLNTTNREVNGQYSNLKGQTNSSKQTNSKIYWRSTMVNPILHLNFVIL